MSDEKNLSDVNASGMVKIRDQAERARFEEWYVQNAFDYVANPIGSRDCALQWKAWQAGRAPMLESMWVEIRREGDRTFPRVIERSQAEAFLRTCNVGPIPTIQPLYTAVDQIKGDHE